MIHFVQCVHHSTYYHLSGLRKLKFFSVTIFICNSKYWANKHRVYIKVRIRFTAQLIRFNSPTTLQLSSVRRWSALLLLQFSFWELQQWDSRWQHLTTHNSKTRQTCSWHVTVSLTILKFFWAHSSVNVNTKESNTKRWHEPFRKSCKREKHNRGWPSSPSQ